VSTRCCLLSTYRKSAEEPYSLPPPAASVHPHQTTPSIAGNDAGECGQGHACEVLAAVAVAGPVLFGLGGDGVHAARHEAEVVGEGEQALARPERADGVPGIPRDGLGDEMVSAGDEVVLCVVVRHAQALGGAAQWHGGCRRDVYLHAVAELCGQLERLYAAGERRMRSASASSSITKPQELVNVVK
jgi:hypothetical protein